MDEIRNIQLKCGICGNSRFEYDDTLYSSVESAEALTCTVCKKEYTQKEIEEANTTLIINSIEDLAKNTLKKEL